jgi:DNA polymerase-3 subunit epsilon
MIDTRWRLRFSIGIASLGLGLVVLAAASFWHDRPGFWVIVGFTGGGALGLAGLALAWVQIDAHFARIERLRRTVLLLGEHGVPMPPPRLGRREALDRLELAIGELGGHEIARHESRDRRLGVVLGALDQPILVVTPRGQISLVNAAAKSLFGEHVAPGLSVFELFERRSFARTLDQAAAAAVPQEAELLSARGDRVAATVTDLGEEMGALLRFAAGEAAFRRHLEHDLALHDRPPDPRPISHDMVLTELPILVFDTETTGLDVAADRIVSAGGVRMHGLRIFPTHTFDLLCDPGMPIPPRSTAIHGITDAMVAGAPKFSDVADRIAAACREMVVVGHNIGFDMAMIDREMKLAGLDWVRPVTLDTLNLYAALRPDAVKLDLEAVAGDLGIEIRGRHTALGDALMTAEIFRRIVPMLAGAGIVTLASAIGFALRPKQVVRRQRAAGW